MIVQDHRGYRHREGVDRPITQKMQKSSLARLHPKTCASPA